MGDHQTPIPDLHNRGGQSSPPTNHPFFDDAVARSYTGEFGEPQSCEIGAGRVAAEHAGGRRKRRWLFRTSRTLMAFCLPLG
jgi:hypothetical protein